MLDEGLNDSSHRLIYLILFVLYLSSGESTASEHFKICLRRSARLPWSGCQGLGWHEHQLGDLGGGGCGHRVQASEAVLFLLAWQWGSRRELLGASDL